MDMHAATPEADKSSFEKWSTYVDNFVRLDATGAELAPRNTVYLKRTLKPNQVDMKNVEYVGGLECKICVNTYRLYFVENSEDFFHRCTHSVPSESQKQRRRERFRHWAQQAFEKMGHADAS